MSYRDDRYTQYNRYNYEKSEFPLTKKSKKVTK